MRGTISNNEVLELSSSVLSISNHRKLQSNIPRKSDTSYFMSPQYLASTESILSIMSCRVSSAFRLQQIILCLLGRFPFQIFQNPLPSQSEKKNRIPRQIGARVLEFVNWMYFFFTSVALLFLLVMTTLGFAIFYLSWHFIVKSHYYDMELAHFNENLVPFVIFWGCLLHASVGSVAFFWNRKYIVNYFKVWNEVVDLLHIPFPSCVQKFLIISNVLIFGFFLIVALFYYKNYVRVVRGVPWLMMLLIFRPFYPDDQNLIHLDTLSISGVIGLVIMLYVVYASRALVLFFIFNCRLLRVCFNNWNHRLKLEVELKRCNWERNGVSNDNVEKAACDRLFRDHCILIKMMRRTDVVFGAILQSYYLSQILNMCFELYYLAQKNCLTRKPEDILAAFILIAQTFFVFFKVSLEGAYVNDSAMEGFQILRSRGIHYRDSVEKKYLIQNLLVNYSHSIVLTGGKFFSLDRPLIIRVLGAVFTFFIIILQFGSQLNGDCN